ncbi:MAG: FecR family protein [Lachnospiraceae bacterium]|nr:FecR family protein [Lachnospiraceae bacterium]
MKKALIITGIFVAIFAAAGFLIYFFLFRETDYRSIKVFEINGVCDVERNGEKLEAFKNMSLSSGDVLTVAKDGFTRLKLDDDKYVYLQADTRVRLTATGSEKNSRTKVFVERGMMTTEVKKKLSAKSSYDIVTPNTSMSIRGTITNTKVVLADDGEVQTSSAVVEGKVDYTVYKKGEDGKTVAVEKQLAEGEALSVSTAKNDLVDEKILEEIIDSGLKVSENDEVTVMTPEEADVEFEAPAFTADELASLQKLIEQFGPFMSQIYEYVKENYGSELEGIEGLEGFDPLKGVESLKDLEGLKGIQNIVDMIGGSGDAESDDGYDYEDSYDDGGSGDREDGDKRGDIGENLDTESVEQAIGFLKGIFGDKQ